MTSDRVVSNVSETKKNKGIVANI